MASKPVSRPFTYLVITALAGIKIDYDASIWHYKYPLQDVKTQNISKYFDEVSAKIDKGFDILLS